MTLLSSSSPTGRQVVNPKAETPRRGASDTSPRSGLEASTMNRSVAEGPFRLTELPFKQAALAPVVSEETIRLHHGKHHAGYVEKANAEVARLGISSSSPLAIIRHAREAAETDLYRNAAQAWNHDFYWRSLSEKGGAPAGALQTAIKHAFESVQALNSELVEKGAGQFASGWLWLCADDQGELSIETTSNADSPAFDGTTCLLTVDVWEHAYYLDYQNERKSYLKEIIETRLNWDFASSNYQTALPT